MDILIPLKFKSKILDRYHRYRIKRLKKKIKKYAQDDKEFNDFIEQLYQID